MKILVIEDEKNTANLIRVELAEENYAVDISHDGEEGQTLAENTFYDVIVLDIILPGKSGLEVCRELRSRNITSRILMLSCLDSVTERVQGLDAGADDYLTKPFELSEMRARIRALLRRDFNAGSPILKIKNLTLDTVSKQIHLDGEKYNLPERNTLFYFS